MVQLPLLAVLTVGGLLRGAPHPPVPADQQVDAAAGGVQVPQPDHLAPALGQVGPLVRQGPAHHAYREEDVSERHREYYECHDGATKGSLMSE